MEDKINVTFRCNACGGTILELPDDYTDDSVVKCKLCGIDFGTYGDVKARAMNAVAVDFKNQIKKSFKRIKSIKVK